MKHLLRDNYISLVIMGLRLSTLAIKFVFTLFIARFLGVEELGMYGLLAAIFMILPAFLSLSQQHSISRNVPVVPVEQTRQDIALYLTYLLGLYAVILLATLGYAYVTQDFILPLLTFAILLLEHINNNGYQFCQNLSYNMMANAMHFIRNAVWMIGFMICAYLMPEYATMDYLLLSWCIGSVIAAIMLTYTIQEYIQLFPKSFSGFFGHIKEKYRINKHNFLNAQLFSIFSYAGHFIITFFLGLEQTGVYVFFMQLYSAMQNLIRTGLHQIVRKNMITSFHNKEYERFRSQTKQLHQKTFVFSLLFTLVAIPTAYLLVQYVVKDEVIASELYLFPMLLMGFIAMNQAESYKVSFYCAHEDVVIFHQDAMMAGITLTLSAILCFYLGLAGAVYASIIAAVSYYLFFRKQATHYQYIA